MKKIMLTIEIEDEIQKEKEEWCSNHLLLTIFAAVCWSATPAIFLIADIQRGYDALGGEAFVPVLPFFVWLIEKAIEDDRRN